MGTTTRLFYARSVIVAAKLTAAPGVEQCLVAVMTGEGSGAHWNPMDTTRHEAGATPYNSFGPGGDEHVWNFASPESGVGATVATLLQPNMARWVNVLRLPNPSALDGCRAFSQCPWGGIGDVLPLELVQEWNKHTRDYVVDRQHVVSGPGNWTYRSDGHPMG